MAFFAAVLALTLLLASEVKAQESKSERTVVQTDEATTSTTETEETTVQDGETTDPSANEEGTVAAAQQTPSNEPKQSVQQGGQQAGAGDDSGDASRATAQGQTVQITESGDSDNIVDRIAISAEGCEVASDAVVVVRDDDGTRVRLTNGQNVRITPDDNVVEIVGAGTGGNLVDLNPSGGDQQFGTVSQTVTGDVVSLSGITACDRANNDGNGSGNSNKANEDDRGNLNCDELLRRFRGGGGNAQYIDVDIQNQLIVCLAQEVDQQTAADEKLPDTGGLPLLGIAALGLASAMVGASVIRGRRDD